MKPPNESDQSSRRGGPPGSPPAAFLLAQVGAHAAAKFAGRLAELQLAPPHAGIMGILRTQPALTQQALAGVLGMQPSRLVALVDELETRALIERRENSEDRRSYALHLTEKGHAALSAIGRVGREHQQARQPEMDPTDSVLEVMTISSKGEEKASLIEGDSGMDIDTPSVKYPPLTLRCANV